MAWPGHGTEAASTLGHHPPSVGGAAARGPPCKPRESVSSWKGRWRGERSQRLEPTPSHPARTAPAGHRVQSLLLGLQGAALLSGVLACSKIADHAEPSCS